MALNYQAANCACANIVTVEIDKCGYSFSSVENNYHV